MEFIKGMTKIRSLIILIFSIVLFVGCAGKIPVANMTLEERFNLGMEYLEKEKYFNAQQEFQTIVISGSYTELGDDAQFYLAESYFKNKEYILAISEYERLTRNMKYSEYVEKARWRICEAYVAESPEYYRDQENTDKALQKLQEFIDEYPNSEYNDKAKKTIHELRNKLAQKIYHTGELYIKLRAWDSALIAFNDLLTNYYDTDLIEETHVEMVHIYILMNDTEQAKKYIKLNSDKIVSSEAKQKIQTYLSSIKNKTK